ncbi:hypothetical protein [Streptomyces sp. RKAG293]|uniref:hypothetical protein n=1 Tax=Streptomyces sp. RKAG293 TaxID=2893403 RepID=UPI0020345529|nr:hypothetical protein [Streptomyces sp. RKAG293]MCM2422689.1 hypothetical protein [Streptomyces sp. RKAG293]
MTTSKLAPIEERPVVASPPGLMTMLAFAALADEWAVLQALQADGVSEPSRLARLRAVLRVSV